MEKGGGNRDAKGAAFESHNWVFLMSSGDIPSSFRDTKKVEQEIHMSHKDYDPFLWHQN